MELRLKNGVNVLVNDRNNECKIELADGMKLKIGIDGTLENIETPRGVDEATEKFMMAIRESVEELRLS